MINMYLWKKNEGWKRKERRRVTRQPPHSCVNKVLFLKSFHLSYYGDNTTEAIYMKIQTQYKHSVLLALLMLA